MDRTRECRRIGVRERRQAAEFGGAVEHAVEAAEFAFDPRCKFGIVVGQGAFQVERIEVQAGGCVEVR